MAQNELSELKTEKESLEKIKEEHFTCHQKIQNLLSDIEQLRSELRTAQLENRNREQEERKNILYSNNNTSEKNSVPKKNRVIKSSELPLLNTSKEYRKEKMVKMMDMDEVNEFKKRSRQNAHSSFIRCCSFLFS